MDLIQSKISAIEELCQNYSVAELFLFGSALRNELDEESDVDFMVDFKEVPREDYADNYFALKQSLEDLLKREVDLLEQKAIHNPYLKEEINSHKEKIYG